MAMKRYLELDIERKLRQLEELEEKYAKYGEDECEDGVVVIFDYQFVPGGRVYSYAAIKAGGLWYTTGPKSPKAFTWEQFIDWLESAANDVELYVVTEIERLV